jgi:hypothetical protein
VLAARHGTEVEEEHVAALEAALETERDERRRSL